MLPPPATASQADVVHWLVDIEFFTNLGALVNQYRKDIGEREGYRIAPEHVHGLRYTPATVEAPAQVQFTTGATPIPLTPRIESVRGHGECYTEWVIPHRGERDGETERLVGWGPDYYRQEHLSSQGRVSHRGQRELKLKKDCVEPGLDIIMKPRSQAEVPHRFTHPLPLSQRQFTHAAPNPSLRPLPPVPQISQQSVHYTYRVLRAPGMPGPEYTDHVLLAAVTFVNPHNPQARPPPPPEGPPPQPRVVRVLNWNEGIEPGHELGWEGEEQHDGMRGRAQTPPFYEYDPVREQGREVRLGERPW